MADNVFNPFVNDFVRHRDGLFRVAGVVILHADQLIALNSALRVNVFNTYTEKDRTESGVYEKGQYYGITAGPAYRINDWASIYGVVGVGYGKFQDNSYPNKADMSDYGFSYGAGLQFNPIENVALDFSYEQSRIRNVDVGTWIAGVGYRF